MAAGPNPAAMGRPTKGILATAAMGGLRPLHVSGDGHGPYSRAQNLMAGVRETGGRNEG